MSHRLQKKNSIVIGQSVPALVSRRLEALGCPPSDQGGTDLFEFQLVDSGRMTNTDLVKDLAATLVKEACGSTKGVMKRPEGDVVLDTEGDVTRSSFAAATKKVGVNFTSLPADDGVAMIAEMTYNRCLRQQFPNDVLIVTEFPSCLAGPEGTQRADYVIAGLVVLSYFQRAGASSRLRANIKAIETLMGRMCSQEFVDSVLPPAWQKAEELTLDRLPDALDEVQLAISDYWSDSPQNERAKAYAGFLMNAVGTDLRAIARKLVKEAGGVFKGSRKTAEAVMHLCEDWVSMCEKMTSIDWGASWGSTPFVDPSMKRVRGRLDTVMALRSLFDEVTSLLDEQDLRALRGDTLWDVLEAIDVFDATNASETKWGLGVETFNRRLEPIEHRCAAQLRDFFNERINLSPQAILNEMLQFRQLVKRPIVGKELASERDTLLAKLSERVASIRLEYERRANDLDSNDTLREDRRAQAGRYMPGVINKIVWIRQLRGKIAQMLTMSQAMLSDLARHGQFTDAANQLLSDLEEFERESFKNWTFDVKDNEDALTLDKKAPVMRFNNERKIEVNYAERLVELLREVRLFTAMGFQVPSDIQKMAQQAAKFYEAGVSLKQVANTYNTMDKDIIRCTRAMTLASAMGFDESVGGDTSRITWSNTGDTAAFIQRIRKAAGVLTDENRTIHTIHQDIVKIVCELFDIDLLRSRDRWMGRVSQISEKVMKAPFKPETKAGWLRHWDHQIYKALEHQYQRGLESLHESLSEIRADVIYDSNVGRVVLRPPIEQIRQTYYAKLRDFLNFPVRFAGVGDSKIFHKMPGFNERGILAVMQHSASLFKRLSKEVARFQPLIVVGQCGLEASKFTLEEIVSAALTEVQHWEQAIRLLKQKGKEIGAVDIFIKIDCITLSTAGIKSAVEEQLARLADVLNSTLRASATRHLTTINGFLDGALEAMDSQFTKLEDMKKLGAEHDRLQKERPDYEIEFHQFDKKNELVRKMTGSAGIPVRDTKRRWERFIERLDSYEKEKEERLEAMKASVGQALEAFFKDLDTFAAQWNELKPKDPKAEGAVIFVQEKSAAFKTLKETADDLAKQCEFFSIDPPDFSLVKELDEDLVLYAAMWAVMHQFNEEVKVYHAENWLTFRKNLFSFEDFVKQWQDQLRNSEHATSPIGIHLRTLLDGWLRLTPTLKFCRGDGFTPEHWSEMFRIIGVRGATSDTMLFGQLLDAHEIILSEEKALKGLSARAQGEAQIREALDDLRSWANTTTFKLVPHTDRKGVNLITEWKEVMTSVNDNQALLMSMKDSPYFKRFKEDAVQWEAKLARADDYLHHMNQIQRKWVYLEPIFARGALPQEQQRFQTTDKEYLGIMTAVTKDPKVISLTQHADYKTRLRTILEQLDKCQKALNEFLEEKREKFPRFYFVSDDDLLEILGQSRNVQVIQSHLKKLFMGIYAVRFDKQQKYIEQICSLEGEVVELLTPVEIKVEVEDWLNDLDVEMKRTLTKHLQQCVEHLDVSKYASQILCACEQIHFTRKTEEAMAEPDKNGGMKGHRASLNKQLKDLTSFSASNTDEVLGLKIRALIMDLIHSIEVVDMLIKQNVTSPADWRWRKQLRFYLDRKGECFMKMVDASFRYSYEYQGNAPKLVHTPLTDKCYLTLTQGMHLGYGGNPYGPAGTGKTESVKALGNAMGRQVLVFNCDEGIDFKSMGRIFTGLVKCGAWGCFDEFNRLKVDQLSAVSQMIQVIQEALKQGEDKCLLLGRNINVDSNAGIFVTLNPAGKGYGGRSKLPDNLKQLFRSVAMAAPDNQLITETILFSEGFENATELATKVIAVFRLSKQLLSNQQHYDWGLRALKAVLRLGGVLVHQYLKDKLTNGVTHTPAEVIAVESEILIKSLRVNTLSKLTFEDVKLFNGLIADVFPGIAIREIEYGELKPAILEAIKELKLQTLEGQIQKILQLYEAMNQRMGVVLVGPSGSGKSTLLKILRKAMQRLGVTVPLWAMNPKAMPREQLLGKMDLDTREWYDGVLTEAAKKVVREESTVKSWIFCDGDIDPEWVESLNSVLDDNKLLTLPNGVRIQFGGNVNFVFETHSLEFASPATVSRMGMIFLSEEDVDPKAAITSWLAEQAPEVAGPLKPWLDEYFPKAIDLLIATNALVVDTTRMGLVMSGLSQMVGCTDRAEFAMALIKGLGSYLPEAQRVEFAKDVFHLTSERAPDPKNPLNCYFDKGRGKLNSFRYESTLDLTMEDLKSHPMIKTVQVQRDISVMDAWVNGASMRPFIIVGPEGCGKTMLLRNAFANLAGARVAVVNCSAQTTANHVVHKLKQTCGTWSTNQGRVLRPKDADRLILVLKDLNLPKPDKYKTVMLHSFLQQLILYNGFYDTDDLEWVSVERVQIVASMNPPGSMGRFPVASRFIAIVSVLSVAYPSPEALSTIYSDFFLSLLQSPQLQSLPQGVSAKSAADFARAVTTVYEGVVKKFTVDDSSHYVFNPRDITKWVLSVLNYMADGTDLMQLLAYEGARIFGDRLVSPEHRRTFDKLLGDGLATLGWQKKDDPSRVFASWLVSDNKARRLGTAEVADLKKAVQQAKIQYEREERDIEIHLIPEVLSWMVRVDRVLSQDGGSALLVGRSGNSASEIVRLAAFQLKMSLFSLNITRTYGIKNFRNDVKAAVTAAGVEGQHSVLYIEDYHLIDGAFLEAINSLLSSGEIPGLFSQEELDAALAPMKEDAMAEGFVEGVYSYFVHRVMTYLHVMVVMDNTHPEYELRCRSNPALFTRCTVMWVGEWSTESMKLVPKMMLKDVFRALEQRNDAGGKEFALHRELVKMHQSAGSRFSPQHFKTLIASYDAIFKVKASASGESLLKLQRGLDKLAEAEQSVDTIQKEVTEKKKQMEIKQKEADEALVQIQAKMEEASEQKKKIKAIQKDVDKETKVVEEKAKVIEGKLSGIQPTLDAAKEAVGQIENRHLTELKSLKAPPPAVQDVLEGVLTLLGHSDITWASMRKFLAGDGVKQILGLNPEKITPATRDNVEKLLKAKANSFKPEVIERASRAAAPMAPWIVANVDYSRVIVSIQPMRDELKGYEDNLSKLNEKVKKYEDKVKKVDETIDGLKKNFANKTKEAERLKDKLEQAENTLSAAQELLSKLGGEKVRWGAQVAVIQGDEALMPKRALLAAGFMTYLGNEPEDQRRKITTQWAQDLGLPDGFNYFTFMRAESVMLLYKAQGLPSDELSMENAVTILDQVRCPLIVDPANQALEWIKAHMKAKDLSIEVCTPADERFMNSLELAVRFGKTLLITEIDKIEPILYPLIRRELRTDGPKKVVRIGDKEVDWAESFQLFLLTRSTDLKLAPDVAAHLSEISFTITRGGLEGQLLGVTIQQEQPELEAQKVELLKKEEGLKLQLSQLEDSLLRDLATSQGSLLDNKTLIDSLNQLKTQAQSIQEALEESKRLSTELDEKRNVYRPLAAKGSSIFFLMRDLRALSHMYQFSLSTYLALFNRALASLRDEQIHTDDKIDQLGVKLVQLVVQFVSRALFKNDRVTFGVHMARGLNPECCTGGEWDYFVDKSLATDSSSEALPSWVPADGASSFKALRAACPHMMKKLNLHESDTWYQWLRSATPESDLPGFVMDLPHFQRLIVVKALRPDRLIAAMNAWACQLLRVDTLSEATSLANLLPTTKADEPVILLTTPGADPGMELQALAYEKVGRAKFHQVAMGGGQAEEAMSQLKRCAASGEWLCLKNLHLVIPWVSVLEQELNLLTPHKDFRLWLTSEPHDEFPSILLSTALKITFEAPPGLKQNLMRTYSFWDSSFLSTKTPVQCQILFSLALLHATVQERRSYIPQGWTKFYEFSQADIKSAADVVVAQSQNDKIDWATIHGVLENAIYGGRFESDFDVRVLLRYFDRLLRDEVLSTAKRQEALMSGVTLPATNSRDDYIKLIGHFADSDIPALFALPPNADRTVQRSKVAGVTVDLVKLYERANVGQMSREQWATALTPLLTLWVNLCQPHAELLTLGAGKRDARPIEGFVHAEVENSLALVSKVEQTMSDLRKVIDGTLLLSEKLKLEATTMLAGEVPLSWDGKFSGPEAIIPWLKVLVRKAVAIRHWSQLAADGSLIKSPLNLSDLFRPETFLNALRQETARHTREALVSLRLVSNIGAPPPRCALPVVLTHLMLQGATLAGDKLDEVQASDAPAAIQMPDVYIGWVPQHDVEEATTPTVGVPVYTNLAKDTFLVELMLRCDSTSDAGRNTLAGTTIVLEL